MRSFLNDKSATAANNECKALARCIGVMQHIFGRKFTNASTTKAKTSAKIDGQKDQLCGVLYYCIKNMERRICKKLPHERDDFALREIFGADVLMGAVQLLAQEPPTPSPAQQGILQPPPLRP